MAEPPKEQLDRLIEAIEAEDRPAIRDVLADLHPADVGRLLESLTPEQRDLAWAEIETESKGEVLVEVAEGVQSDLLEDMDKSEMVAAVRGLDTDDIADLIPILPDDVLADVLFTVDKVARAGLGEVLSYPEDTAGGLMDVDTLMVRGNVPIRAVIRYLRLLGRLPEHTDKLFVVDRKSRLRGILTLANLLTAPPENRVKDHFDNEPKVFKAMDPEDDVAERFQKYNLISGPVVDEDYKLIGRITIDDVVDVIRETADRSVMVRAGLSEEEDIFAPVRRTTRSRSVWLGVNLITAIIASIVIGQFESTIERLVALAVLMPIVASMGGNAGMQTLTVVIRGLGTGIISSSNARKVLKKEFLVGSLNGIVWAIAVAVVAVVWYQDLALGMVIAVAIFVNLVCAALAGVALPIVVQKFGIDPALAGGVTLTTVTDVIGFFSVLGLAALFLV
ncbi:MAG: Magnesium transporter MgtE [Gammaproteobacteria bacterium]|nr:Magnesium transporter MgtE [Gammaproteobacteria bacterium]